MIKTYMRRLKGVLVSDSALPWYYCAYITVFSMYVVARLITYLDFLKNTDPVWMLRDSPSSWFAFHVLGVAAFGLFLVALLLVRAKNAIPDGFGRAHARYMLSAFWSMLAIWGIEFFLYWTPLAFFFHWYEPHLRFAAGFLYLLLLVRLVIGFVRYRNKKYPSPKVPISLSKKILIVTGVLSIPFVFNWLLVYGAFHYWDWLSQTGSNHTFTVATKSNGSNSLYKIRLVYKSVNPGFLCKSYGFMSKSWGGRFVTSYLYREPVITTEHEQVFIFGTNEIEPGYCDWHFDSVEMFDARPGYLSFSSRTSNYEYLTQGFNKLTANNWRYEIKE